MSWPARGSLEIPLAGSVIDEEIEMKQTQYIVIQGDPIDGYTFTGPMPRKGADLLYSHLILTADAYIAPLQEPQAIPVPVSELDPEELPF